MSIILFFKRFQLVHFHRGFRHKISHYKNYLCANNVSSHDLMCFIWSDKMLPLASLVVTLYRCNILWWHLSSKEWCKRKYLHSLNYFILMLQFSFEMLYLMWISWCIIGENITMMKDVKCVFSSVEAGNRGII